MPNAHLFSPDHLRTEMRRRGLRQADIADAVGCNQAQVSRLLSGDSSSGSKTYREICRFVLDFEQADRQAGRRLIESALAECWDGSMEDARRIAGVLKALTAFRHQPDRSE
ncbi:helix-turn-helix domain-containing protein [Salinisphaera hydrothermalis]|uniref:helix-turn-helix domain-containing protein n=1 Tax=Salinisphaera hydrothermalis TaxID=563188 RepID=UPI00333F24DA